MIESVVPNLRQSRSVRVAAVILLCTLLIPDSAHSQIRQSQRRLSTAPEVAAPLDQIRLLMRLQKLNLSRMLSTKHPQGGLNASNQQLRQLAESLNLLNGHEKRSLPESAQRTRPDEAPKLSDRQRLAEELREPVPEMQSPSQLTPPARTTRRPRPQPQKTDRSRSDEVQDDSSHMRRSTAERASGQELPNESMRRWWKKSFGSDSSRGNPGVTQPERRERQKRSGNRQMAGDSPSFDIAQELSSRGLERTFRRLVSDVRRSIQEDTRTDSSPRQTTPINSVWNQTLANVVDTVRDDVFDIVRASANDRIDAPTRSTIPSEIKPDSRAASAKKSDADSSQRVPSSSVKSSPPTNVTNDSPSTVLRNPLGQPSAFTESNMLQLLIILAGLAMAVVVFLSLAHRTTLAQRAERKRTLCAIAPQRIHTRADVIRAFHWLTHCQSPDAADWWNHRQAETRLLQQTSARQQSLHQLTELYEAARYQPRDRVFDESHIHLARVALDKFLS